jgi:hypothetical protein
MSGSSGEEPGTYEVELLVGVYEELGNNFRHFLMWRRLLFAGYFAIVAGLGAVFNWTLTNMSDLAFLVPAAAVALSVIFWALDLRNRNLIRITSEAGASLEDKMGLGLIGQYSLYKQRHKQPNTKTSKYVLTHSWILGTFYALAILAFVTLFLSLI